MIACGRCWQVRMEQRLEQMTAQLAAQAVLISQLQATTGAEGDKGRPKHHAVARRRPATPSSDGSGGSVGSATPSAPAGSTAGGAVVHAGAGARGTGGGVPALNFGALGASAAGGDSGAAPLRRRESGSAAGGGGAAARDAVPALVASAPAPAAVVVPSVAAAPLVATHAAAVPAVGLVTTAAIEGVPSAAAAAHGVPAAAAAQSVPSASATRAASPLATVAPVVATGAALPPTTILPQAPVVSAAGTSTGGPSSVAGAHPGAKGASTTDAASALDARATATQVDPQSALLLVGAAAPVVVSSAAAAAAAPAAVAGARDTRARGPSDAGVVVPMATVTAPAPIVAAPVSTVAAAGAPPAASGAPAAGRDAIAGVAHAAPEAPAVAADAFVLTHSWQTLPSRTAVGVIYSSAVLGAAAEPSRGGDDTVAAWRAVLPAGTEFVAGPPPRARAPSFWDVELAIPPATASGSAVAGAFGVSADTRVADLYGAFARALGLSTAVVALLVPDEAPAIVRGRAVAGSGRDFGGALLYGHDETCAGGMLFAFPPQVSVSVVVSDDDYASASRRFSEVSGCVGLGVVAGTRLIRLRTCVQFVANQQALRASMSARATNE